jgi:hypothetical protein
MKTIATGYATILALVGALALTGMTCPVAQTGAGADGRITVSQYCAPLDEDSPDARRFYCRSGA